MNITIKWFTDSKYPSFNVSLSNQGKEPFLEIKGCRIVKSKDGSPSGFDEFVAWPSTKNEKTQKYWNHVYASREFADVVLKKAKQSQPTEKQEVKKSSDGGGFEDIDSDIPW